MTVFNLDLCEACCPVYDQSLISKNFDSADRVN